jgi:hypothetical protein
MESNEEFWLRKQNGLLRDHITIYNHFKVIDSCSSCKHSQANGLSSTGAVCTLCGCCNEILYYDICKGYKRDLESFIK